MYRKGIIIVLGLTLFVTGCSASSYNMIASQVGRAQENTVTSVDNDSAGITEKELVPSMYADTDINKTRSENNLDWLFANTEDVDITDWKSVFKEDMDNLATFAILNGGIAKGFDYTYLPVYSTDGRVIAVYGIIKEYDRPYYALLEVGMSKPDEYRGYVQASRTSNGSSKLIALIESGTPFFLVYTSGSIVGITEESRYRIEGVEQEEYNIPEDLKVKRLNEYEEIKYVLDSSSNYPLHYSVDYHIEKIEYYENNTYQVTITANAVDEIIENAGTWAVYDSLGNELAIAFPDILKRSVFIDKQEYGSVIIPLLFAKKPDTGTYKLVNTVSEQDKRVLVFSVREDGGIQCCDE